MKTEDFEMSMISEQVKKIREFGENRKLDVFSYDEVNSILSQAADTIEALSAKLQAANMENGGGWISCEDRLPEDGIDVLVWFEYFRYGEYNRLFQTIGISFAHNGEWSGFVNGSSGWNQLSILAWQPLPKPYRP